MKLRDETDTSTDSYRTTATLLWFKVRNLVRLGGMLLVLLGVYHFLFTVQFGLPALEIYQQYVPQMLAVADGGGVFDAGHLIPIVVGAIIVWFTP
mgnify:FL=1